MKPTSLALLVVMVVTAVELSAASRVASADRGVAIDLSRIEIGQRLSRGGTYKLPSIGVRNPGTEPTRYRMRVGYFEDQPGSRPPEEWFNFEPGELSLQPGDTGEVGVELHIPTGARPDDYEALIQAEIAPEGEGTTVGAAAAAKLSFTVKPSNLLQAWQLKAQDFGRENMPWTYVVPGTGALAAAVWWLRKRFTISIGRRS